MSICAISGMQVKWRRKGDLLSGLSAKKFRDVFAMKLGRTIEATLILALSVFIGLALCEAGARLVLNPADYLSTSTIKDDVLGITVAPNRSGFDEWGFRNQAVPATADVVAIGDSHTFGNTAAMTDAWPSVVARQTQLQVYNLGLGGYGPNQYWYLLKTKGLKLHPSWVICGLYMGDDFENAFSITYGLDYWSGLRRQHWTNVDADIWGKDEAPVWGASVRNWLSEHSILYRLVVHGPLVAIIKETIRFKQASNNEDPYTTILTVGDQNIREAFRPLGIAERLDQKSRRVQEGMRITFHLLKEMDQTCKLEGCRFLTVIIPTKEMVFSDYLEKNDTLHLHESIGGLIESERLARQALFEFLQDEDISYLDTLPALKRSVGNKLYAQATRDMHPGPNGYRIIGKTVAEYLSQQVIAAGGSRSLKSESRVTVR